MGPSRSTARSRLKRNAKLASLARVGGASRGPRLKHPLRGAKRPSWKLVGLAGLAGVAATGVVVARNRRAQRDVAPDELRERLHSRLAETGAGTEPPPPPAPGPPEQPPASPPSPAEPPPA